jgi:hypothetical protein
MERPRTSICLLILIASALALLLSGVSSARSDEKHQDPDHRRSDSKANVPTPAFTIIVQPAPVHVIQQAPPIEEKQAAEKSYERPMITDWGVLIVTLAYTGISLGLWCTTNRQAKLMQAQFDQRIELANWRCVEKPRDDQLKIRVDLVNPSGYPVTFTGYLRVGSQEQIFPNQILSPNTASPKSIDFQISIAGNRWGTVHSTVKGNFTHVDRITGHSIPDDWKGMLKCEWLGLMKKWDVTFTRFAHTEG